MLKQLNITDFAIIDDLTIPFKEGLNVLTGETGAGKSIIVQALALIAGGRASPTLIRTGSECAVVSAEFEVGDYNKGLLSILSSIGIGGCRDLKIERSITRSGKGRVVINGVSVSQGMLKEISPYLVEISSQQESRLLLDEASHLDVIDRYGLLLKEREAYRDLYIQWADLKRKIEETRERLASIREREEFLRHELSMIDALALRPGEEEELEEERLIAKNSARLLELVGGAESSLISSDDSISSRLASVLRSLEEAAGLDPSLSEHVSTAEAALVSIEELSRDISGYLGRLNLDPSRLDEIEERLYSIQNLKKRFGVDSIEGILKKRDAIEEDLSLLENPDVKLEGMEEELEEIELKLSRLAGRLSLKRDAAAKRLASQVREELVSLGFKNALFIPAHTKLDYKAGGERGIDRFLFLISPNPGESPKPLSEIASLGELSRVLLSVKSLIAKYASGAGVYVFDEIDVGVGGAVAEMVGIKLKEMSADRQVIVITHLPQVASLADHHIAVRKEEKRGRVVVSFSALDEDGRVRELARMLAGVEVTKTAIAHAREMLQKRNQDG